MDELAHWPTVKRVVMLENRRQTGELIQRETHYSLSSLPENAFAFAAITRNHWSIENHLHWMLDVVFHEDQCRTRKDNGADNLATTRKLALQVLRHAPDKDSIAHRRLKAAWNDNYLRQLLTNAFNR